MRQSWMVILGIVSLLTISLTPISSGLATENYPSDIEVKAGSQSGPFPKAIESNDGLTLKVSNSSQYQYPNEYWIEQGDQGMTGNFPDDIQEDDSNYIQVADYGHNGLGIDPPQTLMHWNFSNVPYGSLYTVQHKGYFHVDNSYCSNVLYRLYVWDGSGWNERINMDDKYGSSNEAWDSYNLSSSEYQSGSPRVYVQALCMIDEQETIIRDYTNVIRIVVYRQTDVIFEWNDLPISQYRLDFEARAVNTITAQIYNESSSNWESLTTISTSWTEYSYDLKFDWFNSTSPSLRFYGNTSNGYLNVSLDYVILVDLYQKEIDDLQGQINNLKKEIEDLRDLLSDFPNYPQVKETGDLPFVPLGYRNYRFLGAGQSICTAHNSYIGVSYEVHDNDTGNDLALYDLYDKDDNLLDYSRASSSELRIAGSYSHLWINDTKSTATTSDDTVILDTTEAISYYDLVYAYNLTVQANSGSTIKVDRISRMDLVYCSDWSRSFQGKYRLNFGIENEITQDWRNVVMAFYFPRDVNPDLYSVIIHDNNLDMDLEAGQHFSLSRTNAMLEFLYLNSSDSRSFELEFTEAQDTQGLLEFTITDSEVKHTQDDRHYFRISYVQDSTASFYGKMRIEYDFTEKYAGKIPDSSNALVFVNGKGTDQFVFYDDRLEIYQVQFPEDSVNTIEAYFKFREKENPLEATALSLIIPIIIGLLSLAIGIKWIHESQGIRVSDGKVKIKPKERMTFILGLALTILGLLTLSIVWQLHG